MAKTDFTKNVRARTNTRAHLEEKPKKKVTRFNLNLEDEEYLTYLQQMAWLNKTSITAYLNGLIEADMQAHASWAGGLDELNKKRTDLLNS